MLQIPIIIARNIWPIFSAAQRPANLHSYSDSGLINLTVGKYVRYLATSRVVKFKSNGVGVGL
jgi:hypothetical protein